MFHLYGRDKAVPSAWSRCVDLRVMPSLCDGGGGPGSGRDAAAIGSSRVARCTFTSNSKKPLETAVIANTWKRNKRILMDSYC